MLLLKMIPNSINNRRFGDISQVGGEKAGYIEGTVISPASLPISEGWKA
jgi:hypothetical protein